MSWLWLILAPVWVVTGYYMRWGIDVAERWVRRWFS